MLSVTMKARKENVQLINIVCFYFLLLIQTGRCDNYINKFAVHVPKGYHAAQALVRDHGYIFHGQIGALENHFLLEHPHVHRRSATHSSEHHEKLSDHPEVHWFEQQQVVSRKKRDFQPVPAEFVHKQAAGVAPSRQRRDVARPNMQFNDELYGKMWYFNGGGKDHTDMNVQGAWRRGVTGKNVVITILDDGIERNHEDLVDNYDADASFDVNGNDGDPMPRYDYTNENRHGTRCAGEVSAKANNTKCVVGVAYNSKIGGIRMLDGDVYDAVEATSLSYNRSHIDIYSASWGPDDDGRVVDGPGPLAKKAFIDGIKMGRNGKGSIFVWASGNGGNQKDSCNCDGYTNSIYTLSISSISQTGLKPWYLEECSSTLASTYSSGAYGEKQIITVDLHNRCTEMHTGTSASAPLAAGIVALILEINPHLTWRDVQYITLMTSRPLPNGEWVTNGVGRQVSLRYGYGLMDATAMVDLAEKWTKIPAQHICEVQSDKISVEIPDSGYAEILDTNACAGTNKAINYLEHTQAKMTIKTKRRGDLVIHLTSPMGTRSTILPARPNDRDRAKGFNEWEFLSVHFWGENPVGQWKLEIDVQKNTGRSPYFGSSSGVPASNILVKWSLVMYGTEENPVNLVPPTAHPPTGEPVTVPGSCHAQCLGGCTGNGADQCNACQNYKMQDSGVCVPSCPNNYYLDGLLCRVCNSSCETCTHISNQEVMCLKCKPGYLLVEGKGTCVPKCDKGYYKEQDTTTTALPCTERSDIECGAGVMSVFIPGDLIPADRNVTWRDEDCDVTFNGTHYSSTVALDECGTTIQMDEETVTFSNDLIVHTAPDPDHDSYDLYQYAYDDITLGENFEMVVPVKCVYPRHRNVSVKYTPVKQNIRFFERKYGELQVRMDQYLDAEFSEEVPAGTFPREVPLNDDVYIRLALMMDREDLKLKVDSCIATSTPAPSDVNWRQLIKNGCAQKPAQVISKADDNDVKFTFKAFDFRHNASGLVYVHCEVYVCRPREPDCTINCHARARRAAADGPFGGSHLVSTGPLIVSKPRDSVTEWSSTPMMLAGVAALVAMVAVVVAVLGWTRKVTLVKQGGI